MRISTNKDLAEHGLDNIVNIDTGTALRMIAAGHVVCSAGQDRLASRATGGAGGGQKLAMTMSRYYVVEANGHAWPVEIGRLRREGEVGHGLAPLGSSRMPLDAVASFEPAMAMKLDKGDRALLRMDAMPLIQEVYPLLGWQAEFDRCTIHYNVRSAAIGTLVMVRRTL